MANICFTFEIDGRPAYMAFTSEVDARTRLGRGFDVIEYGRSVLRPTSVVSIRPSRRKEIDAFIALAVETCRTGRTEWDDVMEGYPIFLIAGANPDRPEDDINTGLPIGASQNVDLTPQPFAFGIDDLRRLYSGAPLRTAAQAA